MPETEIHPTAIVDPHAQLGTGVYVGPYSIIGPDVTLGDGCWLQHHVTIAGPARIGKNNKFFAYDSIAQQTQDLKYRGEPTHVEIGDDNSFREYVSVHRATFPGNTTRIGNRGNFLAYAHIAHDCTVGDDVIFSNNGTLAGHVQVGDHVIIGGLSAIHQFCRIGRHAILGGCTKIVQDVPPFMIADGNPAEIRGINKVGMERHDFTPETIRQIKEAYRLLYRMNLNVKDAAEQIHEKLAPIPEICQLLEFLQTSERGIVR
ncbi:MAG: acyl-ACP--UDP-N-acetylglucosamine O-acyltransferase [Chthoniobacteraceae bacterium]